jgi:hypothetical protein
MAISFVVRSGDERGARLDARDALDPHVSCTSRAAGCSPSEGVIVQKRGM